jgi:pimeloyl-ACP methyl ester carboxylesterase
LELVAPGHDGRRQGALRRHRGLSQTDFTEDLKKINAPVLVMHSEDDQIVPYVAAGPLSAKLLKHSTGRYRLTPPLRKIAFLRRDGRSS